MFSRLLPMLIGIALSGCGSPPPPPAVAEGPLTIADWKAMTDIQTKYDGATMERLRQGEPSLQEEKAWREFEKTVIVPQRAIDVPPPKYHN